MISLEPWDRVWRRNQHLVARLLQSRRVGRVLFVEPADDPLYALITGRKISLRTEGPSQNALEGVAGGVLWSYRPRKWLPRRIDPDGDERRAMKVKRVADRLGFVDPILWVNDPGGAALLRQTGWPTMYDITDDWLLADRPQAELARIQKNEAELLQWSSEVVVCSENLRASKAAVRAATLIPNAVDADSYRTLHSRPNDLPAGRTAVYVGTVHEDRMDVELCVTTAKRLTDRVGSNAHVVLVGPTPLPSTVRDLLAGAGVVLLGSRPSAEIPAYLQHADVLIVPHKTTAFTESLDPIKAYEYRAAGRRVVTTPVPGFAPDKLTRVARGDDFVEAVVEFCSSADEWTPPDLGAVPTWTTRAEAMADVLDRVASSR